MPIYTIGMKSGTPKKPSKLRAAMREATIIAATSTSLLVVQQVAEAQGWDIPIKRALSPLINRNVYEIEQGIRRSQETPAIKTPAPAFAHTS